MRIVEYFQYQIVSLDIGQEGNYLTFILLKSDFEKCSQLFHTFFKGDTICKPNRMIILLSVVKNTNLTSTQPLPQPQLVYYKYDFTLKIWSDQRSILDKLPCFLLKEKKMKT